METTVKNNKPSNSISSQKTQSGQSDNKQGMKTSVGKENDMANLPSDNDQLPPEEENSSNKGQGPAGENL